MFEAQVNTITNRFAKLSDKFSRGRIEFYYRDGCKTYRAPLNATTCGFSIYKTVSLQTKGQPKAKKDIRKQVEKLVKEYGIMHGWYMCETLYLRLEKPYPDIVPGGCIKLCDYATHIKY
jgi:hypothetical protein